MTISENFRHTKCKLICKYDRKFHATKQIKKNNNSFNDLKKKKKERKTMKSEKH